MTAFKQPFSLLSACRQLPGRIERVGDIVEVMDKTIGRLVFRICGAISANNYIAVDRLHLVGRYLLFQIMTHSNGVASVHLELECSCGSTIRVTMSTLYDNDPPRFFGRSLRLPLPVLSHWSIVVLDVHDIVEKFCNDGAIVSSNPLRSECIKVGGWYTFIGDN